MKYSICLTLMNEVNENLPEKARIRYFVLMHKEFDADEAEMTRSRKLRRGVLAEKYCDIVEAMYNGHKAIKVRAAVKYQDGSEGFVETDVRVMAV